LYKIRLFNVFYRLVFKLTDFGATREMLANAGMQTLYGTEEYLVRYEFDFIVLLYNCCLE